MMVFVHEWRSSGCHFVDQNSEGPPINCETMTCHIQDLRCKVFSCSTEALCALIRLQELRKTKVSKFDIPIHIHQYVFRLEISMNDFVSMQVSQTYKNLGTDKFNGLLLKSSTFAQVIKQITTIHVFQKEIQSQFILEYITHIDNERVLGLC